MSRRAMDSDSRLPRSIYMETRDPQEMATWARQAGLDNDYVQIGKGPFRARRRVTLSNDLIVAQQFTNRELVIKGNLSGDFVLFLNPLNRRNRGILEGERIEPDAFGLVGPSPKAFYRTPPLLRMQFVFIRAARLQALLEATEGPDLETILPTTRLISCADTRAQLSSLAKEILYSPDASSEEHLSKIWLPELEEHFVGALLSALSAGETPSCSRTQRLSYVNRAQEFISANYDAPLGLESLASACGVCARTLEYAFRDILNVTPLAYVKSLRLRTARSQLQGDQGHRGDVARVALRCGFSHMGHFARDYYRLFGEHPSDTLWNRTKSGSSIE